MVNTTVNEQSIAWINLLNRIVAVQVSDTTKAEVRFPAGYIKKPVSTITHYLTAAEPFVVTTVGAEVFHHLAALISSTILERFLS